MVFRPEPQAIIGGKYRLVRRLAGGGMGAVWLARHQTLDSDIAVKLMSPALIDTPTARSRFEREAKASAQLKSPHIVRVHDYGVEDGTPFMVMEALEGEDLGERLDRLGSLALPEVASLAMQIAKALRVAHTAGIVHRDLKPSNIFLSCEDGDETVKLLDFGIARETRTRLVKEVDGEPRELVEERTGSGVVLGSPHHMSPEQTHGDKVDHRSDLWSLGVVLFRALAGCRPFDGEVMTAVMLAVVSKPVPSVLDSRPELPPELDRFFSTALSRDLSKRFDSAMDMAHALDAIAKGESPDRFMRTASDLEVTRLGRGPDDVTLDGVPAATPLELRKAAPAAERAAPTDSTGSREFGVVTTGLGQNPRRSSLRWALVAVGVIAVGLGLLVYLASTPPPQIAEDQTSSSPAGAPALETQTRVTPAASPPTGEVTASTTSPPPSATPSVVSARAFVAPAPARTLATGEVQRPKPKIDPFTGLPIP